MNEQMIRWDDLQIVLAIAESGSLSGAGRQLGLSHATVFRRLNDMEERLGVSLFLRTARGYTPTPAGEDVASTARRVQADVLGTERRMAGRDMKLSGTLRITTTDTLFYGLLSPLFADFRERHPDIQLEVVISNQIHSLSKREADIAIRPTRKPPDTLLGRRVADITQAIYGQRAQWQQQHLPMPLADLDAESWIGPDVHMGDTRLEQWMATPGRADRCHYRVDSMLGMQLAVRAGAGVAALPCYLGDADDALLKLTDTQPDLTIPLWILTHPDSRRVMRIRTFTDEIGDVLRERLKP